MKQDYDRFSKMDYQDLVNWPTVLEDNLPTLKRELYKRRKGAVNAYFKKEKTVDQICAEHGIRKGELYRLLNRCLETHGDGRLFGYRALIPFQRVKNTKNAPFETLLERYPNLKEDLENDFLNAVKKGGLYEKNISIKNVHKIFVRNCLKTGLSLNEYPLNTKTKAFKSVQRFINSLSDKHFIAVAARYGDEAAMLAKNTGVGYSQYQSTTVNRPFERVEFDGHKLDISLAVKYKTLEGDEIIDTINRIWILSIIDVSTRCILGYHLCLQKEYSSDDVLMCIRNAIKPWEPRKLAIPELEYPVHSGFPSSVIEETKFGIWDEFCYDNAKANISKIVQEKLNNFVGCSINMGPVATPIRRPHIERFYNTLETNGFHRIVSTTGNAPTDPRRRKNTEQLAIKYQISVEHIEDIVDVLIAEYNATPHSGLSGLTPLEVMQQRIDRGMSISSLAEDQRDEFLFFTTKINRVIRGDVKGGRRPFVTYEGVKYTNEVVSNMPSLIGKKVTLLVNVDDIRFIRVHLENGSELGILTAIGKWGIHPHSLRERKAINKLKNSGEVHIPQGEDPIEVYHNYLRSNANTKNGRNMLASFEKNQDSKNKRYDRSSEPIEETDMKETKEENNKHKSNKPNIKLRKTLQF
ncbi:hypothetical protein [Sporosarcina koreensis]|uniref:Integrase catalytic domain-containing protein n=1 Tax=Sporosarcina koreensis TaxID=334735 RepID=A0ABW0TWF0_9BACL